MTSAAPADASNTAAQATAVAALRSPGPSAGLRETIESLAVAFVLAFLFRTFCAESFVIPTGSMAPALLGRHKDVECLACGQPFQVNTAGEIDYETGRPRGVWVRAGTCPVCRHTRSLRNDSTEADRAPSYNGDRILAVKHPYALGGPRRWDVTVFRFPEQADECYIKRLVGLPRETVRIWQGDLWRAGADGSLEILRKPADKIMAMAQLVHDADRQPRQQGVPSWQSRWHSQVPAGENVSPLGAIGAAATSDGLGNWQAEPSGSTFVSRGAKQAMAWLRYSHSPPGDDDWARAERAEVNEPAPNPPPQLITDFAAYNTYRYGAGSGRPECLGLHWVGDLIVECELDVLQQGESKSGIVQLELIKAGRRAVCTIDCGSGQVELSHPQLKTTCRSLGPAWSGPGRRRIRFAHVDRALHLWINDRLARFDAPATYDSTDDETPTAADLSPVGIGALNAAVRLSHLRVLRDNYYVAANGRHDPLCDYPPGDRQSPARLEADELCQLWSDPSRWPGLPARRHVDFPLGSDEYLLLGDNSPESRDARLWAQGHAVAGDLLVGKALLVYWPHAWETGWNWQLPGRGVRFPSYPSFSRMRLIR